MLQDFIQGKRITLAKTNESRHFVDTISLAGFDVALNGSVVLGILFGKELPGNLHMGFRCPQAAFTCIVGDRQIKTGYPCKIIVFIVQKSNDQSKFLIKILVTKVIFTDCLNHNLIEYAEKIVGISLIKRILSSLEQLVPVVDGALDVLLHTT